MRYLQLWPLAVWALIMWFGARAEHLPLPPWPPTRPPPVTQRPPRGAIGGRQAVTRSSSW